LWIVVDLIDEIKGSLMFKNVLATVIIIALLAHSNKATAVVNTDYCERDCSMEYQFFLKYSRQGSSIADMSLALMNYLGHGRDVNIALANRLLKRAAKANLPAAMYQLGYFLMYGMHMEQDEEKALSWFKKAARAGVIDGKTKVALLQKRISSGSKTMLSAQSSLLNDNNKNTSTQESATSMEIITVVAYFYWSHLLYTAEKQTCTHASCANQKSYQSHAIFPIIKLKGE